MVVRHAPHPCKARDSPAIMSEQKPHLSRPHVLYWNWVHHPLGQKRQQLTVAPPPSLMRNVPSFRNVRPGTNQRAHWEGQSSRPDRRAGPQEAHTQWERHRPSPQGWVGVRGRLSGLTDHPLKTFTLHLRTCLEEGRETSIGCRPYMSQPGIAPPNQACALPGNRTGRLSVQPGSLHF